MLNILEDGHKELHTIANDIPIGEDVSKLADDMIELMNEHNGVGLAGPQVGILKRIIAVKIGGEDDIILNPIIKPIGKAKFNKLEGCLSYPGRQISVKRYKKINLTGYSIDWEPIEVNLGGMAATIIQHEVDHLNRITIVLDN